MRWAEIGRRAAATAVQSGTAVLIGDGVDLIDIGTWQTAAVAALGGVITVLHRAATRYLEGTPEPWGYLTLPYPEDPAS